MAISETFPKQRCTISRRQPPIRYLSCGCTGPTLDPILCILSRKVVAINDHLKHFQYDHYYGIIMRTKLQGAVSPLIALDRKDAKPFHRQIYDAFRAMILRRALQPGQQVPSTRSLATELGISRIPVLGAYDQLLAEGYFESRLGAGTFVSSFLPDEALGERPGGRSGRVKPGPVVISRLSRSLPSGIGYVDPRIGTFQRGPTRVRSFSVSGLVRSGNASGTQSAGQFDELYGPDGIKEVSRGHRGLSSDRPRGGLRSPADHGGEWLTASSGSVRPCPARSGQPGLGGRARLRLDAAGPDAFRLPA